LRSDGTVFLNSAPLLKICWRRVSDTPEHGEFSSYPCAGYMGHLYKKGLFDNDLYAFQAPFLRTDVLSSQHRVERTGLLT
jgi:hypothetical protein